MTQLAQDIPDEQNKNRWETLSEELLRLRSVDLDNAKLHVQVARLESQLRIIKATDVQDPPDEDVEDAILRLSAIIWPDTTLAITVENKAVLVWGGTDVLIRLAGNEDDTARTMRCLRGALMGIIYADRI